MITLLDKSDLKALPLSGQKWYEIDDIQDLDIAETLLPILKPDFRSIKEVWRLLAFPPGLLISVI